MLIYVFLGDTLIGIGLTEKLEANEQASSKIYSYTTARHRDSGTPLTVFGTTDIHVR